jgi:hypothetical protein
MALKSSLAHAQLVASIREEAPAACLAAIIRKRLRASTETSSLDNGEPVTVSGMVSSADGASLTVINPVDGGEYFVSIRRVGA